VKIQEPSSSIRESSRKTPRVAETTHLNLFIPGEPTGACPSSKGALPRPHVLVSQRNARILYASETTRLPTGHGFTLPQRHTVFMRAGRRLGVSAQMGGELLIFYLCTDPFLHYDDKESSSTSVKNTWDACRWIVTTM
jgi:hypothetical protein